MDSSEVIEIPNFMSAVNIWGSMLSFDELIKRTEWTAWKGMIYSAAVIFVHVEGWKRREYWCISFRRLVKWKQLHATSGILRCLEDCRLKKSIIRNLAKGKLLYWQVVRSRRSALRRSHHLEAYRHPISMTAYSDNTIRLCIRSFWDSCCSRCTFLNTFLLNSRVFLNDVVAFAKIYFFVFVLRIFAKLLQWHIFCNDYFTSVEGIQFRCLAAVSYLKNATNMLSAIEIAH